MWKIENYSDFLEARREFLATETNKRLAELLHGDLHWLEGVAKPPPSPSVVSIIGGITSEAEEEELEELNDWVAALGLPRGVLAFDFADETSGEQRALFDLAWPSGIQEELSQPVAVLLNENSETLALASRAGFRCFTSAQAFRDYVQKEILANEESQNAPTAEMQSVQS